MTGYARGYSPYGAHMDAPFAERGRAGVPVHAAREKVVAVVQSNYIPWKGYFDLINSVDTFILYDDMQYTRRDWRNRNKIKTPSGAAWLTVPVEQKGRRRQKIIETRISDAGWAAKHWKTIAHNYSKARYFEMYRPFFEELYLDCREELLSLINFRFIKSICALLGIGTRLTWSMHYDLSGDKTERLVNLCKQEGAGAYLSGPTARGYLEEDLFRQAGIELRYMDYAGYPEYSQQYPPFEHAVSIVDLILNEGPHAAAYMKSF